MSVAKSSGPSRARICLGSQNNAAGDGAGRAFCVAVPRSRMGSFTQLRCFLARGEGLCGRRRKIVCSFTPGHYGKVTVGFSAGDLMLVPKEFKP